MNYSSFWETKVINKEAVLLLLTNTPWYLAGKTLCDAKHDVDVEKFPVKSGLLHNFTLCPAPPKR